MGTLRVFLALLGAVGQVPDMSGAGREPAPLNERYERQVFSATNRERAARGIAPLVWDETLARQARQHSTRMRDLRFFSHSDPKFGDIAQRLTRAGIPWTACAENIHEQQGYPNPPDFAVRSWLGSAGHRKNLLDPRYNLTGIGVATDPGGTYYFTQIFIRR